MSEKTKKVENGPIARLIRTVGFFLVLIASLFFGIKTVGALNINAIQKVIEPVEDIINFDLGFLSEHIYVVLLAGILLLLWTQAKTYFTKIFVTILSLVMMFVINSVPDYFIVENFVDLTQIVPFLPEVESINDLLIKFFDISKWIVLIIIIPLLFLSVTLSSKKPRRISTQLVANGLILVLLSTVIVYLPVALGQDWHEGPTAWFNYVVNSLLTLSFVTIALGSLFGVLGLFRK